MTNEEKKRQTRAVLETLLFNIGVCFDSAKSLDDDYDIQAVKQNLYDAQLAVIKGLEALNG